MDKETMSKEKQKRYEEETPLENEVKRLLEIYQLLLDIIPADKFNVKLNVSNNRQTEIMIELKTNDFRDPLEDFFKITIGKGGKLEILRFYDFIAKEFYEEIIAKINGVLEKYS
jgi:hypothetical protein